MSKAKKVLLGVVITIMTIVAVGIITIMIYDAMKEEPRFSLHHPSSIDGKVIEIIDKKIKVGNVISVEFWCENVEFKENMDIVKVKDIYIDNWHDFDYEVEYK